MKHSFSHHLFTKHLLSICAILDPERPWETSVSTSIKALGGGEGGQDGVNLSLDDSLAVHRVP